MRNSILLLLFLIITKTIAFSQKPFEGTIVYKIELDGDMDYIAAFLPEKMTFEFKGKKFKSIFSGKAHSMMGWILYPGKNDVNYLINDEEMTASEIPHNKVEFPSSIKVKKTTESETILGYKCDLYIVVYTDEGVEKTKYLWTTEELKIEKTNALKVMPDVAIDGVNGFPLKIQSTVSDIKITFIAELVQKQKISKSVFRIPDGYILKKEY